MGSIIRLAVNDIPGQWGETNRCGITMRESLLIANGNRICDVFSTKGRMGQVVSNLNRELKRKGLKSIKPEDSLTGRLLSSMEIDVRSHFWGAEPGVYAVQTGTYVAFKGGGQRLGSEIVFRDSATKEAYVFEVPSEYRNVQNAILAMQHDFLPTGMPTFTFSKIREGYFVDVADKEKIVLLPNFPTEDGWYVQDPFFGMPLGRKVGSDEPGARYLHLRRKDGDYSGFIVRLLPNCLSNYTSDILAGSPPFAYHGVLISARSGFEQRPPFEYARSLWVINGASAAHGPSRQR
ncbi:MAG: hypothetical protein WC717_05790 [Candidatus Micrarchaeia archaeon]|jgi:hypothetical protein